VPLAEDLRGHVLSGQGENEGQEQAGGAPARHHQGVDFARGREEQGVPQRVSAGVCEEVGGVAEHVHARLWRPLQGAVLLDADDGGRACGAPHQRLHRHHSEEEEGARVRARGRRGGGGRDGRGGGNIFDKCGER